MELYASKNIEAEKQLLLNYFPEHGKVDDDKKPIWFLWFLKHHVCGMLCIFVLCLFGCSRRQSLRSVIFMPLVLMCKLSGCRCSHVVGGNIAALNRDSTSSHDPKHVPYLHHHLALHPRTLAHQLPLRPPLPVLALAPVPALALVLVLVLALVLALVPPHHSSTPQSTLHSPPPLYPNPHH